MCCTVLYLQVVAELAAISQSLVEAGSVGTPTQRGPLAARTMSRAFNISLKSRATSASQRSRVSKGISQVILQVSLLPWFRMVAACLQSGDTAR